MKNSNLIATWCENFDLENIVTAIKVDILEQLLNETNYDAQKRDFVVDGFRNGFNIHYEGPTNVKMKSNNLKFRIGTPHELWEKMMKEVAAGRYAGPFEEIPFENFIQSPVGLVPKDGGKKTRLIFHLSHPRSGGSVNAGIPKERCTVKYPDFEEAVKMCLTAGISCHIAKSDMSMAFRNAPLRKTVWFLMVMKVSHPETGKTYYLVDKCLPFGCSESCAIFQAISDSIAHIV